MASVAAAGDWPHWRGPSANGVSIEKGVPVEWSGERNIAWKAPLPGVGTSTPIIWGDRVFVTSQAGDAPIEQRGHDFENSSAAKKTGAREKVEFTINAFRHRDGRLLWEYRVPAEGALPAVHRKHNLASPSCLTDGEMVWAWFGTGQLVALTLDGKLVWKRSLGADYGAYEILWGHGSSPALYNNSLLLLSDHQGSAYLLALDKRTGRQLWKADRGKDRRSYSTPFVVPGKDHDELIVNSSERIDALDPTTGELLWHAGEPNRVPIAMPVFHNGVIYATRGYNSGPYMALRPGGRGDVSRTHLEWEVKTGAPYISSLLYYQGLLYMANEMGIATCIDASSGKLLWRERFGGVFTASPVVADGKVYLVNESGETFVLAAGRELRILHRNALGERTLASPAISGGLLFLRTDEHLVAVGRVTARR